MKKLLVLLIFISLLNSCDDGNMQVESFDFSAAKTEECSVGTTDFFIYKITGNEALIIKVSEELFENAIGKDSATIGTNATVIYRLYDGPVSVNTLCSPIPASNPKVIEEWNATGGKVNIVTNTVKTTNETTGSSRITSFNHNITLTDITFNTGNGEQRNSIIPFGVYNTKVGTVVGEFTSDLKHCDNNDLYIIAGSQILTLSLDDPTYADLFANVPTTAGSPKTALINTTNTMNVRILNAAVLDGAVCGNPAGLPTILEVWNANPGVENTSGIVSVETTTNGSGFDHKVTLRNVVFQNPATQLDFTFGTNYVFGTYTSN